MTPAIRILLRFWVPSLLCTEPMPNPSGPIEHDLVITEGTARSRDAAPRGGLPDCNNNTIHDICDLSCGQQGGPCNVPGCGQSQDCNLNAIPDECDISSGAASDCNTNGIPDGCDVAAGTSPDTNANQIPDECETTILFVDADATGAGTGTSWGDAFHNPQDALAAAAAAGGLFEIWVAEGTYMPDGGYWPVGGEHVVGAGGRELSFELASGVALFGGFSGIEISREQRDTAAHESVLSGDRFGDDGPGFQNVTDNSYQVLEAQVNVDSTALLDGFVITAGNATSGSPNDAGGGLRINGGYPTVRGCAFRANNAKYGGGVHLWSQSTSIFSHCIFEGNLAEEGGGLRSDGESNPKVYNCIFRTNRAESYGGGAYYRGALTAQNWMVNCQFTGNVAEVEGGAIRFDTSGITIVNCTFVGNHAVQPGGRGGLEQTNGQTKVVRNCILWGNTDGDPKNDPLLDQIDTDGAWDVAYTCLQGWDGAYGGGTSTGDDPQFVDADGPDDVYGSADDDLRLLQGSTLIDAGRNAEVLPDAADLNGNGVTDEPAPVDLRGISRFLDDTQTPDCPRPGADCGTPPIVDLGAFEFGDCDANSTPDDCDTDCALPGCAAFATCGLAPDCNDNRLPDGCDIQQGVSPDCNGNLVPDECDVATAASPDCNGNLIPDECDVSACAPGDPDCADCNANGVPDGCDEVAALVVCVWEGGTPCPGDAGRECWNSPENWCPEAVPDNLSGIAFAVDLGNSAPLVTLNISPTIDVLTLPPGTVVEMNDTSAANVRSLAVGSAIINEGVLRSTDRERLVLDAPEINQSGGGVIEATDGIEGPGEQAAKSIVEINGARVVGGTVATSGSNSEIHLIGGAELDGVSVQGVVVPDGQTGQFRGTVANSGQLSVATNGAQISLFAPGASASVLQGDGGNDDRVLLGWDMAAWLGSFSSSFTNAANHRIEGNGIIFGGFTNDGVINATDPRDVQGELMLFPPGAKTSDGMLMASGQGTLRIADNILGAGGIVASEGTVLVTDGSFVQAGTAEVLAGGRLDLAGTTLLVLSGDLILDDQLAPCCACCELCLGRGANTPPILRLAGAVADIQQSLALLGSTNTVIDAGSSVTLGGHFLNLSISMTCFDWLGQLQLDGSTPQSIELAGEDRGPDPSGWVDNFAIDTLRVEPGRIVDLIDTFDNDGDALTDCDEALYVRTLSLGAGSVVRLGGCNAYYETLIDEGATIENQGGGALIRIILGDINRDGAVDLNDFVTFASCFGACVDTPAVGCSAAAAISCDLDSSGCIDLGDFVTFAQNFGQQPG